jgi:hypothetical protein
MSVGTAAAGEGGDDSVRAIEASVW